MQPATAPSQRALNTINRLAQRLFKVAEQRSAATESWETTAARHKARLAKYDTMLGIIMQQLSTLIAGIQLPDGKKSFATLYATFHQRTDSVSFKITDAKGVLRTASELGITPLVTIEVVTTTRVPSADILQKYLQVHPEHAEQFMPYIRMPGTKTVQWVTPNAALEKAFDTRLSTKSISLTPPS